MKLLVRGLCAIALGMLWGGPSSQATAQQETSPDPVPQVDKPGVNRESIEARIAELEADTQTDEETRTRIVKLLRDVLKKLDEEQANLVLADEYLRSIATAPEEAKRLRGELEAKRTTKDRTPWQANGASVESVQQELAGMLAELANLRSQHSEWARKFTEEDARPSQIQASLSDARTKLAELETERAVPAPGPEAPEAERAQRMLVNARYRFRLTQIQMLEQELLANTARVALYASQRDLVSWRVDQLEARTRTIEKWISQQRQEAAERAKAEADQLESEAREKHPIIQAIARDIAKISSDANDVLPRIASTQRERDNKEGKLAQIRADLEQTRSSLDLVITETLGTVLLEQRRNLPDARLFRKAAADRSTQANEARFNRLRIGRELADLKDPEAQLDTLLSKIQEPLTQEEEQALREESLQLLETKRESLELLDKALKDYLKAIGALESLEEQWITLVDQLAALLDEQLLWIPNAPRLGTSIFGQLFDDVGKLIRPTIWRETWLVAKADFQKQPAAYIIVSLLLGGLGLGSSRFKARLATISSRVGRVREDGILLTLEALFLHTLMRIPIPAATAYFGWRLIKASGTTNAAKAVGAGILTASAVGFALRLTRRLFRDEGLLNKHFHWSARTGKLVRRHLIWFQAIALPMSFLTVMTNFHSDAVLRIGIGRVAFIVLMGAGATLCFFLLSPSHGIVTGPSLGSKGIWLRRSRPLWRPVGVLVFLALAIMSASGYYYAAQQLELRLNQTILILLFAAFIHAFCLRWLTISQRRLALKVALEKRAALAKKIEAGEVETQENQPDASIEIDVAEIGDQTKDLLRISVGLYIAAAIWFAWVGVLPALGILNEIPLPLTHEVLVDGIRQDVNITLADLALSLLVIAVTITAGKNLPGLLEITILQRLPLDPGARYATRTLVLYSIVTTGVLVGFNAIGVGWSSVQWLVAALTVGLGFGLQEIFANFVSGLIILLERPIRVGDTVTVGTTSGVVTRIRMRATTITDWRRRELVVPNKSFITGELINWSLSDPLLRLDFPVGIAYGSNTSLAHKTMLAVCRDHPMVMDQPEPTVFFTSFGDNSLNFDVRVYVTEQSNTGRTRILHDLHMAIDQACRDHGITIAFPQRDLHIKTSEDVIRVSIENAPVDPSAKV